MGQIEEFTDYLKKKLVSEDVDHRWELCQACEFLTPANRCEKCGCFMKLKTKIKGAKCPIGKW